MADLAWRDAIVRVLSKAGQAVHYKTIAEEIEKQGLRKNLGATPANTVSAIINGSMHKDGPQSPFVKTNAGFYMLAAVAMPKRANASKAIPLIEDEVKPIIPCLGMYWNAAKVSWKAKPKLMGQQQAGSKEIDFAEQLGVYILYDRDRVIYVGRSLDRPLGTRLYEHTKDRLNGRWDRFSWFGLRGVDDMGKLTDPDVEVNRLRLIVLLETVLIEALEPPQNRKRGDDFSDSEYLQVADKELQNKNAEAIGALIKNLISPTE